ncbi:MAG TPA: hypothetical protein ENH41_02190 [Candidatus Omnitrophica bacterium]|nr:hypothetical protein [Candidatus Omnitrophota bacterium]
MNKEKFKIKSYVNIAVIVVLSALFVCCGSVYAYDENGKDCASCHEQHNNDEYKQLKRSAVNAGDISCFKCHSSSSESGAPDSQQEFTTAISSHPISDETECLICHELTEKHNDGYLDSWPDVALNDPDTQDSHVYSGAKINNFCLSCHDNSPVTLGSPAETPIDLSSAYEFTGHGRIDIDEPCNSCHNHHASMSKPYLIKDSINSATITGNDNSVCFACHSFSDGIYPGKNTYLSSEHGIQGKLCIDCHNPHGDSKDLCYLCHNANYSAHYSTQRDKLCVDCHDPHQKDDLKMTREDEEKLCYACHSGLESEFGNMRDGASGAFSHHKVDDEEFGGGRLECFECHNPHTVTVLNIVSDPTDPLMFPSPFPDTAYGFKTDIYDNFCLKCHDGSRFGAKDIQAELNDGNYLVSGFTDDGQDNLHREHKNDNFGCQNCHDAHSSNGTGGIQRGALLHEEIIVSDWNASNGYGSGKNSCNTSALGGSCH